MPSLTFTQILVYGIIVAVVWQAAEMTWKWWRNRRLGTGFQRYARDPDFRRAMLKDREQQLQEEEELKRSPELIRKMIDDVLNGKSIPPDPIGTLGHPLGKVGIVARTPLLEATKDPRFFENAELIGPKANGLGLIVQVIGDLRIEEAVNSLVRLLGKADGIELRHSILGALAAIGSDECTEPCRQALRSGEPDDVEAVACPLAWAENPQFASPRFRAAMFEELEAMLPMPLAISPRDYGTALIKLNEARAGEILTSPGSLRKDHVNIHAIAIALACSNIKVDETRLRVLLDHFHLSAFAKQWPNGDIYTCLLTAYGRANPQEAIRMAAKALRDDSCSIKEGIVECAASIIDAAGAEALGLASFPTSKEQELLHYFEAEVMNGGLLQFFANPGGRDAAPVLGLLKRHGCREAARILGEAMALFGPNGPATDTDERSVQISKFSQRKIDKLQSLTDAYYGLEGKNQAPGFLIVRSALEGFMTT